MKPNTLVLIILLILIELDQTVTESPSEAEPKQRKEFRFIIDLDGFPTEQPPSKHQPLNKAENVSEKHVSTPDPCPISPRCAKNGPGSTKHETESNRTAQFKAYSHYALVLVFVVYVAVGVDLILLRFFPHLCCYLSADQMRTSLAPSCRANKEYDEQSTIIAMSEMTPSSEDKI